MADCASRSVGTQANVTGPFGDPVLSAQPNFSPTDAELDAERIRNIKTLERRSRLLQAERELKGEPIYRTKPPASHVALRDYADAQEC